MLKIPVEIIEYQGTLLMPLDRRRSVFFTEYFTRIAARWAVELQVFSWSDD
jgi:hypothetical protein